MIKDKINQQLISEARRCIGTKFRHQGRTETGLDCLGLLVIVAKVLELNDKLGNPLHTHDMLAYGHTPDGAALKEGLEGLLEPCEAPLPGAIGLFEIDGSPRHLGIFGSYNDSLPCCTTVSRDEPKRVRALKARPTGLDASRIGMVMGGTKRSQEAELFSHEVLGALRGQETEQAQKELSLIHAYAPARRVVEHRFDEQWHKRLIAVYAIPEQP